jgi:hypothetical protein
MRSRDAMVSRSTQEDNFYLLEVLLDIRELFIQEKEDR